MQDNAKQIEMWSGPSGRRWVKYLAETDRAFGGFAERTLEVLAAREGERVMDFGCGAGSVVATVSERVGPSGHVLGLDPSAVLVECARERTEHLGNVAFACEDAAVFRASEEFDALYSCLGAMFFADPVAAFDNLRQNLRSGGRMVFCCWQAAQLNRWCATPLEAVLPFAAEPPPRPEPCAPGTFSLADRAYLEGILADAGFHAIELRDVHAPVPIGMGGVEGAVDFALRVGPAASLTEKQTPKVRRTIRARLFELFEDIADGDMVSLPGVAWIVSAVC